MPSETQFLPISLLVERRHRQKQQPGGLDVVREAKEGVATPFGGREDFLEEIVAFQ